MGTLARLLERSSYQSFINGGIENFHIKNGRRKSDVAVLLFYAVKVFYDVLPRKLGQVKVVFGVAHILEIMRV